MMSTLASLALIFAQLSLLAFGGGNTILPEMQRQFVDVHQWMSPQEFSALFALAQSAPGPNLMIVPLLGWHVAGWWGLPVTLIAMFLPSSIVTGLGLQAWIKYKKHPWLPIVRAALLPVTVGLVAASAALITVASDDHWVLLAITAAVAIFSLFTRLHPLWMLLAGGLIGYLGVGQM